MSGALPDRAEEGAEGDRPAPNSAALWADRLEMIALICLVLGSAVGMVLVVRSGWVPVEDTAWMELRVRDIPGHLPLNGVYSRVGGSHPGPAQFYLLWPFYVLLGGASAALLVAMSALHTAAALIAWAAARSLDRIAGLTVLITIETVLLATPVADLRTPWNPQVVLVAGIALVVLAWGTAQRRVWSAALVLPTATLLVQAHAGTVGLVAAALLAGFAGAMIGWSEGHAPMPWRALGAGATLAALWWLPPLWSQLRGDEGRWSELLSGTSEGGSALGVDAALGLLTRALGAWPSWADPSSSAEPYAATSAVVPAFAAIIAAGWWAAWRRRDWCWRRGLAVASCALAGATFVAAIVRDGAYSYLTLPVRIAAAATVALCLAAALGALVPAAQGVLRLLLAGIAVSLAVLGGMRQLSDDVPWGPLGDGAERLSAAVLAEPVPEQGYVMVAEPAWIVGSEAVMLQLDRAGVDVRLRAPQFATQVGPHRRDDGSSDRVELTVAPVQRAEELRRGGWQILAEDRPLSAAERRRSNELTRRIDGLAAAAAAGDRRAGYEQLAAVEQLKELLDGRQELLVAVRPPDPAPG